MTELGVKQYRRDMAAVHDRVASTGDPVTITRDGVPLVRIVPATTEITLEALAAAGRISLPATGRRPAINRAAGGDLDSADLVAQQRR